MQFGPLCPLSASACDLVSLEGTVYNDIDANATLNGSDVGLPAITLNLLNALGNPVLDAMGNPITTTTLPDGSYSFTDLPAGTYAVSVDTSTLPGANPSNIPAPSQTEDPDENGVCAVCDSLTTVAITIPIGQTASNIDFGYTGDSLPVMLSSFGSERASGNIKVDWSTSSELFNVGFQIWGLDAADSKWEKLHGWLVRSGAGNTVEPQSYSKTLNLPSSINELVALGVSSIDSDGREHYYGPFNVGQSYGNLSTLKPIAWNHIRDQVDAQMAARGYTKDRLHGYRKLNTTAKTNSADTSLVAEFHINESGVYRISAQDLVNIGLNWAAVPQRNIALINHKGQGAVRFVAATGTGTGHSRTLGDRGDIFFYAKVPDKTSRLYTNSSIYRLVLDPYRALNAQYQAKRGIKDGFSEFYQTTEVLELDRQYNLNSAADDPWLDTVILSHSNQPRSYAAAIDVEADAMWNRDAVLKLDLASSSALNSIDANNDGVQDAEHILQAVALSENGIGGLLTLGTAQAVGSGNWENEFVIPANTPLSIIDGKVVVGGLFSAGAGYPLSEVHVDSVQLSYTRPYTAKSGDKHLLFQAPEDGAQGYKVTVPNTGWPVVFALSDGNIVRLGLESQVRQTSANGAAQRVVQFATLEGASNSKVSYWVSGKAGLLSVDALSAKSISHKSVLLNQAAVAEFLIISHPTFMGDSLSQYAQHKRNLGFSVAIINYLDVVDTFGGGQVGTFGLTQFLNSVAANHQKLKHVLIVGGSSYDHTNKLGTGAMTFIPGHYGKSSFSKFTVTDSPYVMDSDNQLFATVGRWPVRSQEDLDAIIDTSKAWSNSNHSGGNALLIAEQTIAAENIEFGVAVESVASQLPINWTKTKVYVDEVAKKNQLDLPNQLTQALSLSRDEIISQLNSNPDLVLYNGHGTTSQLSNKGLFKSSDVDVLNNQSGQIWVPMSCYMTYYESTHLNTLAYQLLFHGKAVGITGAMLLSNQSENILAGTAVIKATLNSGKTIGEAVNAHKAEQNSPTLNVNFSILGDPTLKF